MMKSSSTSSPCRRNETGVQCCSSTSTKHQPVNNNNNNNNNKQTNKNEILNWRHSNSQGSPPITPPHQQNCENCRHASLLRSPSGARPRDVGPHDRLLTRAPHSVLRTSQSNDDFQILEVISIHAAARE